MSGTRVVVETECEHGRLDFHWLRLPTPPAFPELSDGCPGGSSRTLTPEVWRGIFYEWFRHQDLVNGATGTWNGEWTAGLADSLLNALAGADHEEGT